MAEICFREGARHLSHKRREGRGAAQRQRSRSRQRGRTRQEPRARSPPRRQAQPVSGAARRLDQALTCRPRNAGVRPGFSRI